MPPPEKFIKPEEMELLIAGLDVIADKARKEGSEVGIRDRMAIVIPLFSGLRLSEVRGLSVQDLLLGPKPSIFVRYGKNNKRRYVTIEDRLATELENFLEEKKTWGEPVTDGAPVFWSKKSKAEQLKDQRYTRRALQKMWYRRRDQLGLRTDLTYHSLRHTYLSELMDKSDNIRYVQEQAGHENPSTTAVYTHVNNERMRRHLDDLYRG